MSQPQVPSNPSSEVSIEEIGAEEELAICEKDTNAQEVSTLHPVWFVRNPFVRNLLKMIIERIDVLSLMSEMHLISIC